MSKFLPTKWEPRKEQIEIVDKFNKLLDLGKKFFVCEAPVGTGKSYAVVLMYNEYLKRYPEAKADLLTNTILLQSQYLHDFSFINSVKGKENYFCDKYRTSCSEGSELSKIDSTVCENCTYSIARNQYLNGQVGLLNFHLFSSFMMYAEDFIVNGRKANILFIDEAHAFEEVYCDFINSYLSIPYLTDLEIGISEEIRFEFSIIQTKRQFADFVSKFVIPKILMKMQELATSAASTRDLSKRVNMMKQFKKLSRTKCKFGRFLNDSQNWESNWIIERGKNDDGVYIKVEAVFGRKYLNEIWEKYDHVVFMSGTILDKLLFSNIMGIDINNTTFLNIDSPFKPENRKIFFLDKGKFSYDVMEETFEACLPELLEIIDHYKGKKGIIHTGNYKLAKWIEERIKDDRLLFHDAKSREVILNKHYSSEKDTILVSPSMMNGVDLRDDYSRFQIILKIPFPSLDNEKIKKRMQQNGKWYQWKTLQDLIQMYGRSVRSEEDWADTFIFDSNFELLSRTIKLPKYITEAIIK